MYFTGFHLKRAWNGLVRIAAGGCAALLLASGTVRAQDNTEDLRARVEKLEKQNEYLMKMLERGVTPAQADGPALPAAKSVEALIADYMKSHPGAGMPSGVQTGYTYGNGFSIRSVPNPKYDNWHDDMKQLPFELRIRGRLQGVYYNYQQTDNTDHITNRDRPLLSGGVEDDADFSALAMKRVRLIFEGHAFDPDLKYRVQLNADTRGLGGFFNNRHVVSGSPVTGGTPAVEGGGVTIDHAARLFEAWISYDWKPGRCKDDCCDSPDCPDGLTYTPTYTFIFGKLKLLGPLEEYLGSGNEQFVEFGMASWFFSPDDDNLAMAAGVQAKMCEDRLYAVALVHNGSESNASAGQLDDYPGINVGFWYDFGGTWDENKKAWQLFGDCMSDVDYARNLVVRVGGAANIVPFDRRRIYGDIEQARYFTVDGGRRLVDILNGSTSGFTHAVDKFDAYTFNAFVAAKYHGFSISNEWWFRYLNNFETVPTGGNVIRYNSNLASNVIFPVNSLFDYGMQLQGGYFVIPDKLEVMARWSMISGQSGNIDGDGVLLPGGIVRGAFRNYETANEYTVGFNYFVRRHLLKFTTDFGIYDGGAPIGPSAAGFPANRDGFLLRSQLQLAF